MGKHISVLLQETIDLLNIKPDGIYVDCTLGRAGTSGEILKRIPNGHLYSFDVDDEAIRESSQKLSEIGNNYTIIHSNFRHLRRELEALGVTSVDGVTIDLGVSSPQFDEGERGFSYKEEARLDMRMDQSRSFSAHEIVNTYSLEDLTRVFREYGEEQDAYSIAKLIVKERSNSPIDTTTQLVDIIKRAKPKKSLLKKGHPAKQVFQALRIEVNDELGALKEALETMVDLIAPNGVIAIISFHSLEDRIVKQKFVSLTKVEGDRHFLALRPEDIEVAPFINLTKKPIVASEEELAYNHRSVSAKLRGIARKED
ncbi:MAG: 16S rRNA (cytosine(1402)-N(4))-methyltransferase RsmH [Bacilli bacterium]|nr:16S rRNA (cytosine(1402)-N(4))-methyltransferase RsmH [Bacilli bacterium]